MAALVSVSGGQTWKKLMEAAVKAADKATVEIGVLEGSGGGYSEYGSMSTATIGFWHEFGTSRAPARSFLRKGMNEHGAQWGAAGTAYLKARSEGLISAPGSTVRGMLNSVGSLAVSDIKRLFSSGQIGPPVSEAREAKKAKYYPQSVGSPLVYSGGLSNAINHEVKE
jgi:hypothetical protein